MKCYQWLMDCRIAVGVVSVPLRLSGHQLVVTILQGPNPLSLLQFPHLGLARIAREAARSLESGQLTFIPGDECLLPYRLQRLGSGRFTDEDDRIELIRQTDNRETGVSRYGQGTDTAEQPLLGQPGLRRRAAHFTEIQVEALRPDSVEETVDASLQGGLRGVDADSTGVRVHGAVLTFIEGESHGEVIVAERSVKVAAHPVITLRYVT